MCRYCKRAYLYRDMERDCLDYMFQTVSLSCIKDWCINYNLSEKKCTVGKHKNSPAYHKPGSHKGKSPYALIPNGNNMMKPYHTLSGRHGMHFSPVSSHMKKDRKYVFSPVSVFCSPLRCNSAGRGQPLNLYMCLTACSYDIFE